MTVDELLDQQAIRDVLIRYTRGIDRMDPDLVRSCYHPDAHDDHGAFRGGTEEFVAWFQEALSFFERTMHFVGNQLVEVDGDVARAESYCVAYHRRANLPSRRRSIGAVANYHSVKNRFLLRINNAPVPEFRRLPTLARDLVVLGGCLFVERTSLRAFSYLARHRRRLFGKRAEIAAKRR